MDIPRSLKINKLLHEIEQQIRLGNAAEARVMLKKIQASKLNNDQAAAFYLLLYRTGSEAIAKRILTKRIRHEKKARIDTQQIWLTYAYCMAESGALATAFRIYNDPLVKRLPNSMLFIARAHLQRFEYEEAAYFLKKYIESSSADNYMICLAEITLARALINLGKERKAIALLQQIQKSIIKYNYNRLTYTLLVVKLFAFVSMKDDRGTKSVCAEIDNEKRQPFYPVDGFFESLLRIQAELPKNKKTALRKFRLLRRECYANPCSEMRRQIDLIIATAEGNQKKIQDIWLGTPNENFRKKITLEPKIPLEIQFRSKTNEIESTLLWPPKSLVPLLQRFFAGVACDAYRKPNLEELFERVYPGHLFNPFTSPNTIRQLIFRFRKAVDKAQIDIDVKIEGTLFWLESKRGLRIILKQPFWQILEKSADQLELDRAHFADGAFFSSKEFATSAGYSIRQAQFLLSKMLLARIITRHKTGREFQYRIQR